MLVFIGKLLLSTLRWEPMFQGFSHLLGFLYHFVFAKLATSNVRVKGQMHHHDGLGSKCAYTCHLSNKTTRKSVLLSTPQIWLMKVSKNWPESGYRGWHYQKWCLGSDCQHCFWLVERYQWHSLPATDIFQPIRSRAGSHFLSTTSDNVSLYTQTQASFFTNFHKPYLRSAEEDRLAGGLIWKVRPLQFNYLSYELFLEKKVCQTPKKIIIKVDYGVLRTKVV